MKFQGEFLEKKQQEASKQVENKNKCEKHTNFVNLSSLWFHFGSNIEVVEALVAVFSGVRYTGLFLLLTQFLRIYLPGLLRLDWGGGAAWRTQIRPNWPGWLPMKLNGQGWLC